MQVNKKKKKKIIISVSVILIILSFPLIMYYGLYRGLGVSFLCLPIEPVIINGPSAVYTDESGTLDYTIDPINKFIKAEGTVEFYSSDPEILEITKDGKWTAKKPGTVEIINHFEYSKKTWNKIKFLNPVEFPIGVPFFKITVSDRQ